MKKIWKSAFLILMLCLGLGTATVRVKAETWTLLGDAASAGSGVSLTKYSTKSVGGIRKNIPIDAREGVTLTFEYRVGDERNQPRNGFMVIFSDSLVKTDSLGYESYGYWDYVGSSVKFCGVEFNTYGLCPAFDNGYSQHIGILSGTGGKVSHVTKCEPSERISDGNWHSIKITYSGKILSVYQDNGLILSSRVVLPSMSYVGITGGTSYYGYQNHQIRNLRFYGNNAVKIFFKANGGSCSVSNRYVLPQCETELPVPTRKGYTFKGWYTASDGGSKVIPSKYGFNDGEILYAQWQENSYKITFHANGGKTSTTSKKVTYGKACGKLPTPKRTKGTFLGWYTAKSGGKKYTSTTKYEVAGNTTLYAHWKMSQYKVTFNGNGGKSSKSQIKVSYGSSIGSLPTASRSKYSFIGWYTKKTGGTKISSKYKVTKSVTLYAHWKKNTGGGSGSGTGSSSGSYCSTCRGTGRCKHCDGSGFIYRYGGIKSSCFYCVYGKCRMCGGDGRL